MRLFLFLVGGTGSRVLKPLIMQLAAGIRPIDENGNAIKNLEVVPIIMDPHKANEDLKRTDGIRTYVTASMVTQVAIRWNVVSSLRGFLRFAI